VNALPFHRSDAPRLYALSWTLSLLLHGLVIGAALVLVAKVHLPPQPEPFHWVVSRIEMPSPPNVSNRAARTDAAPTQPAPQPRPVEAQPVAGTIAPAPPLQASMQQAVPAIAPLPQVSPQPMPGESEALPALPAPPAPPTVAATLPTAGQTPAEAPHQSQASPLMQTRQEPLEQTRSEVRDVTTAQDTSTTVASLTPTLQPGPPAQPAQGTQTTINYGWLAQAIQARVEQWKHYPHIARANRWEGRVVVRAVIGEDGRLLELKISESSGHSLLDEAALEVLKKVAPLPLTQPLGRPQVVVQVPISYRLR